MAYLLHTPPALATVRAELASVIGVSEGTADTVKRLEQCPYLNAVYNEVLRLTNSSSAVRTVVQTTTTVTGKILRKGNRVLIPFRQQHFNSAVFGTNVDDFDPERFSRIKDLDKSASFRPFGHGSTHCPGRFLARREVLLFVALVLQRFDVSLVSVGDRDAEKGREKKTMMPRLEEKKPCLGVMGAVKGDDVLVKLKAVTT